MKTLMVCGSRGFPDKDLVTDTVGKYLEHFLVLIHGDCPNSPDVWAEEVSKSVEQVIVGRFPADWNKYGRMAGALRNKVMVNLADFILVFWDGKSKGTHNVINYAEQINKPYKIFGAINESSKEKS